MKNFRVRTLVFILASLISIGAHGAAHAQSHYFNTFVAAASQGTGDCSSPANACASLYYALANTNDGGVVTCVSHGFFLTQLTISNAVTINCAKAGYTIKALLIDAAGKNVKLSGLTINLAGAQQSLLLSTPLTIRNAATVTIEHSELGNPGAISGSCISDGRNGPAKLMISNTSFGDCGNVAVLIAPQSGTIAAVLDNVKSLNSVYGLAVASGGRVMINRSTFSGNSIAGIEADGGAFVGIDNTLISNNDTGIIAGGSITISNSDINSNNTAISGATQSYGNNRFFANIGLGTAPTPAGATSTDLGQR